MAQVKLLKLAGFEATSKCGRSKLVGFRVLLSAACQHEWPGNQHTTSRRLVSQRQTMAEGWEFFVQLMRSCQCFDVFCLYVPDKGVRNPHPIPTTSSRVGVGDGCGAKNNSATSSRCAFALMAVHCAVVVFSIGACTPGAFGCLVSATGKPRPRASFAGIMYVDSSACQCLPG